MKRPFQVTVLGWLFIIVGDSGNIGITQVSLSARFDSDCHLSVKGLSLTVWKMLAAAQIAEGWTCLESLRKACFVG
jgi:hypothetical protein